MPPEDSRDPTVVTSVSAIRLDPNEVITIYVTDMDGTSEQVEVRSVGPVGSRIGRPEIFIHLGSVSVNDFEDWNTMSAAISEYEWDDPTP